MYGDLQPPDLHADHVSVIPAAARVIADSLTAGTMRNCVQGPGASPWRSDEGCDFAPGASGAESQAGRVSAGSSAGVGGSGGICADGVQGSISVGGSDDVGGRGSVGVCKDIIAQEECKVDGLERIAKQLTNCVMKERHGYICPGRDTGEKPRQNVNACRLGLVRSGTMLSDPAFYNTKFEHRRFVPIAVMLQLRVCAPTDRLLGFEKDLHLQGQQYATTLSILYVGFIIMQLPGMGYNIGINSYTGVVVARLFLGFTEASFFPGVAFPLSRWYKRDEVALRLALVSCGSFLSSAFGSLFASAILHGMQDKLGQGGITILVAICAMFILPDFPHNTRWLTPEERALAISCLAEDSYGKIDELGKRTTMQGLWDAVSDWKAVGQSFFIYFPTLCATVGYDTTVTFPLCASPWVFAGMVAFALTWYSDKKQRCSKYIVVSNALGALSFIMSIFTMSKAARYISLFLMAQVLAGYLVLWGWISNTFFREPAKRAVAVALINTLGQIGNALANYPRLHFSHSTWGFDRHVWCAVISLFDRVVDRSEAFFRVNRQHAGNRGDVKKMSLRLAHSQVALTLPDDGDRHFVSSSSMIITHPTGDPDG
ncbi:major facilitator superfamily domain-containing protein [Suillus lakei]|nr:major facilitator superfamily domain-containing protein [Suillus lakei]